MADPDDKTITLVRRLRAGTDSGSLKWNNIGPTAFSVSLPHGAVSIRSRDGDGEYPFVLDIRNAEGVVVETIETQNTRDWARELQQLYHQARRSAMGVSEVIGDLLGDLPASPDEDIPF